MNMTRKAIALLLSLCLMTGATLALGEAAPTATDAAAPEVTEAVAVTTATLNDTDVVARVNGKDILWSAVTPYYKSLVSYYGEPDATMVEAYRAFALETAIVMELSAQTAAANGLDQYTAEDQAAVFASADTDWQAALDNWVASNGGLTDASTDADKTTAYENAAAYYGTLGYDQEKLRNDYLTRSTYERVNAFVCKDVTVTDEDVLAKYDENVKADQALYENDVDAYEYQVMLYNNQAASSLPLYHPAGYRYVKHILLEVDSTLLAKYTDLQARLEEQMDSETEAAEATAAPDATVDPAAPTADPAATPEPTQEPVTQADVDNAKAEILTSLQTKTAEIYDKIAKGEDFDALITQYAVKADGTATDPGMTGGTYPNGYEVALASASFVPEFVAAAFSVDTVGEVSAPYISDYGVHIVKYMSDVPAGAVELTDTLKTTLHDSMLSEKNSAAMEAWQKAATVEYTGLIKSMADIQGEATAE